MSSKETEKDWKAIYVQIDQMVRRANTHLKEASLQITPYHVNEIGLSNCSTNSSNLFYCQGGTRVDFNYGERRYYQAPLYVKEWDPKSQELYEMYLIKEEAVDPCS